MSDIRIMFTKSAQASYISHLDLVRTMQRVFNRAGIRVVHTQGFNPHPKMFFPLPLSVGMSSECEIMDLEAEEGTDIALLPDAVNKALPAGMKVLEAWEPVMKYGDIKWLSVECVLDYDNGLPEGTAEALNGLFGRDSIIIERKTKRGFGPADIAPMIHSAEVSEENGRAVIRAVISAQNPTLNPTGLVTAIKTYLPAYSPDYAHYCRRGIYNNDFKAFR